MLSPMWLEESAYHVARHGAVEWTGAGKCSSVGVGEVEDLQRMKELIVQLLMRVVAVE